jgi:hypothetical protein
MAVKCASLLCTESPCSRSAHPGWCRRIVRAAGKKCEWPVAARAAARSRRCRLYVSAAATLLIEQDKAHLRSLHPHLGGKKLEQINCDTVDRLTEAKLVEGVPNATVNRLLEIGRAILRRTVRQLGKRATHVFCVREAFVGTQVLTR